MLNTSGGDFCWRLGDVNNSGRVPKARVLSAVGARMEAPKAPRRVGSGDGVSPSPAGVGFGECPLPKNFGGILCEIMHFDAPFTEEYDAILDILRDICEGLNCLLRILFHVFCYFMLPSCYK